MVNKLTNDNNHVQEGLSRIMRKALHRGGEAIQMERRTKSRRHEMNRSSNTSLKMIAGICASMLAVTPAMARHGGYYNDYPVQYNDRGDYNNSYDDGGYYRDRGYRGDNYRGRGCSKGTGGTIIGAVAGGLLGRTVVRRGGDRTAGTIIGAGVGALAGRALDKSSSRRC
jgi:Glycine zipper 2TM domain